MIPPFFSRTFQNLYLRKFQKSLKKSCYCKIYEKKKPISTKWFINGTRTSTFEVFVSKSSEIISFIPRDKIFKICWVGMVLFKLLKKSAQYISGETMCVWDPFSQTVLFSKIPFAFQSIHTWLPNLGIASMDVFSPRSRSTTHRRHWGYVTLQNPQWFVNAVFYSDTCNDCGYSILIYLNIKQNFKEEEKKIQDYFFFHFLIQQ